MISPIPPLDLTCLTDNIELLLQLQRGIEREALRITPQGKLAQTTHPIALGAALTHRWITTDFAEALLEFTTPVYTNIVTLLQGLQELHSHSLRQLSGECLWPLSMPELPDPQQSIALADYGSSLIGRFKHRYRQGLQQRYGAGVQCIAGVHYNFSLPTAFWQQEYPKNSWQEERNISYCRLMRNYYRMGWIIPYLFGASPIISQHFLQICQPMRHFIPITNQLWGLPYATSLRLSDIGYQNQQLPFYPSLNRLDDYLKELRQLLETSCLTVMQQKKSQNNHLQLNNQLLQIENELYFPIRPKAISKENERPWHALQRHGITYVEIRSLDINPFSPIGVTAEQLHFLDLFLIWCLFADPQPMTAQEFSECQQNWQRICIAGRQPGQTITWKGKILPLTEIGGALLTAIQPIAVLFDQHTVEQPYQGACMKIVKAIRDPSHTFSAQLLALIEQQRADSLTALAVPLAKEYRKQLIQQPLRQFSLQELADEQRRSLDEQHILESSTNLTFEQYLAQQLAL